MKNLIIISLLIVVGFNSRGQYTHTLPQITPKSPNSESLGKYGDIPVSLSTGAANVSVPLYELKVGKFSLPITLTYNNRGLKVEEIPSWVGLGWDLQVGGVVTLEQNGLNDFDPNYGMLSIPAYFQDLSNYLAGTLTSQQKLEYLERVINGQEDSQFDKYSYNFPGYSGSFYFSNPQLNVKNIPETDINISKLSDGIKIIDRSGNQYFFENQELTSIQAAQGVERITPFSGSSAYYLSKIITVENRTIYFKYKNYSISYTQTGTSISHMTTPSTGGSCPGSSVSFSDNFIYKENLLLDSIISDAGIILFQHNSAYREDIHKLSATAGNLPSLSKIIIKNYLGTQTNEFDFATSYFGNNDRLKLVSITETNAGVDNKKWSFSYYGESNSFPSFFDYSQDHWGFYNGKGNVYSIPEADYSSFISNWVTNYLSSYADKRSDHNFSQNGLLQKITYPTGGYSQLEYEANKISITNSTQITDLSPFLRIGTQSFTDTKVDANTFNTHNVTVSGSFTIAANTTALVSGFLQSAEAGFYQSRINLTGPTVSVGKIYQAINTPCVGGCQIPIEAGTYTYELIDDDYDNGSTIVSVDAQLTIKTVTISSLTSYEVGGNRITKITNVANMDFPPVIRKFTYNDSLSNVVFRNIPSYYTSSTILGQPPGAYGCLLCSDEYVVHDKNVRPSAGYHIAYKKVTESFEENNQYGIIEHNFKPSDNNLPGNTQPYVNPTNTSWREGVPELENTYKRENNNLILSQQKQFAYNINSSPLTSNGIKVDYEQFCVGSGYIIDETSRKHRTSLVTPYSETFNQNQVIDKSFDNPSLIETSTTTLYQSQNHKQPTEVDATNSQSQTLKQKIVYSYDYNTSIVNGTEAQGIGFLKSSGVLLPIEQISIKNINNVDYVVAATLTTYKTDKSLPDKVYSLKINSPILLSSFTQSSINGSGNFIKDSRYEERLSFISYDNNYNTLEQKKTNDVSNSIIWDYKQMYPVAEIINSSSTDVAYTSFEADGKGNWTFSGNPATDATAITGKKSYTLSGGNISKSGLSTSTTYYVSYWSKNGQQSVNSTTATVGLTKNGWTYYEHKVINPSGGTITVSGTGTIDELRLYPSIAQMTTYTFDPLIGLTTKCDVNNSITYYEYDSFNRLALVRDQDKNILKKICYNYAGQPENCLTCYTTTADWQNISSVYCEQSGGQNTGNQVQDQKDMNPCSGTYNNTRTVTIGYNTTACPLPVQNVTITATTYPRIMGFTATYTNVSTGQVYNLNIGYTFSSQTIGTIPAGTYNLVISKTPNSTTYYFESGCNGQSYTGTSATFNNISVSTSSCNSIIIDTRL